MSRIILDLKSVSKVYGTGESAVTGLKDVSLSFESGQFVLIVGSSGSGKSTLLNVMGLLDRPTSGTIFLDGIDSTTMNENRISEFRNQKIGFIFQFSNLISDLSIIENVMLPRQISGKSDGAYDEALKLLKLVGMDTSAHKRGNAVSGGQAQRAAIARGLINRPSIVFADEPTGNLDSVNSSDVVALMKSTAKKFGCTFVVITHDRNQFGKVDRIITLKDGAIESDDVQK